MSFLEKSIFFSTIVITLLFSVVFHDLFPFSINPLYTKITREFSIIDVKDQTGKKISNEYLGLYLDYASSFEKAGLKSKKSINLMGKSLNRDEVSTHLSSLLKDLKGSSALTITIKTVSMDTSHRPKLNQIIYDISNPNFIPGSQNSNHIYKEDKYYRRIKNEALR